MESKYSQFLNYKFEENNGWKSYFNSLPEDQKTNYLNNHKYNL